MWWAKFILVVAAILSSYAAVRCAIFEHTNNPEETKISFGEPLVAAILWSLIFNWE